MIVSMTGFGDASAERDGTHYAVEVRSLNNRFFKPVIKLPETISGLEPELETMLREKLGRDKAGAGLVTVWGVGYKFDPEAIGPIAMDLAARARPNADMNGQDKGEHLPG